MPRQQTYLAEVIAFRWHGRLPQPRLLAPDLKSPAPVRSPPLVAPADTHCFGFLQLPGKKVTNRKQAAPFTAVDAQAS
jgi:hypothetical protein